MTDLVIRADRRGADWTFDAVALVKRLREVQGYLAYKKQPPPPPRTTIGP